MSILEDSKSKIEWAKRHIPDLESALTRFVDSKPYEFFREASADGLNEFVKLRITKVIPTDISHLVGDIIHSLRASLDYAACDLAEANGARKVDDVHFPFGKDVNAFEASAKKKIKKLSASAQEFIRTLKPYQGGNDLLWLVHYLDLGDKHRKLTPIGISGSTGGYIEHMSGGSISFAVPKWESLEQGMKVATIQIGTDFKGQIHAKTAVAFGEIQSIKSEPILPVINQVVCETDRIIRDIEAVFFV
jgi:hypothetical protein